MKSKKILFLHSSLMRGGAEHALVLLSSYLTQNGFEVAFFLTSPKDSSVSYELPEGIDAFTISQKCNEMRGFRRYCRVIRELRTTVRHIKADLVVTMNSSSAVDVLLATLFCRVKRVACERSNPYLSVKGTVWYTLKRAASAFMDGYVFQTERASQFYPKCVQKKMAVIPNMIDIIEEIKYKPNATVVLSVGNLREVKGHDVLIEAYSSIHDCPYQLVIVGEGDHRAALEKLINEKGLSDKVLLPGRTDRVDEFYQKAVIFVLSSFHEGMPNALMEAMSYGIPCISTDCPMGPRELIEDGVNGILVPVDDSTQLAEAMKKLLESEDLRTNLSKEAFKINNTHNQTNIGSIWCNYFNGLLGKDT